MNSRGGWILFPAALLLGANFRAALSGGLFFQQAVYFLFFACLFLFLRRRPPLSLLPLLTALLAALLFGYGLIQKFLLFPLYLADLPPAGNFYADALRIRLQTGRVFSIFALPTLFGAVCAFLLLFIVHYALAARGRRLAGWLVLALAGLLCLLFSQSFGAILYLAAGLLAYFLLTGRLQMRRLAPLLAGLALVFFLVTALRYKEASRLEPLNLRLANWRQAVRLVAERPLAGWGLGNYQAAVPPVVAKNEPASIYAHNLPLQLLAETGAPLFLLILLGAWAGLRARAPDLRSPENALWTSGLVVVGAYSLLDIGLYFFPAGLAAVFCLAALCRRPPAESREWPVISAILLSGLLLLVFFISANLRREADLALSLDQSDIAAARYRLALRLDPLQYRALAGWAAIAEKRADYARQTELLQRLLKIQPNYAYAHFSLSRLEERAGRPAAALYHAAAAAANNQKNKLYREWHERIQTLFLDQEQPARD